MSLSRAAPLFHSAIRNSNSLHPQTFNICLRCLSRCYDKPLPNRTTSRRFVSVAEHRPQDLPTSAPPRNSGIPDSSIAGGKPRLDDSNLEPEKNNSDFNVVSESNYSVTEDEAQKSKSASENKSSTSTAHGSVASPDPSPSSRPQRKSKLRPRKAAMTLSQSAVKALRQLLEQPEPKLIRVGVKNRGCSGLAYHLEYVEKPGAFDEAVEQDGVKVLIDSKALFSIIGSEMDWIEDKLSRRFVFKNPNITEQCGCGESFSIS